MNIVNSFLTSGYSFSKDENLRKFRFSLLNSLLLIAAFFTFINYFSSVFNFTSFTPFYEKTLLFYAVSCLFTILFLRTNKHNYYLAVNIVILSSLILFYSALFLEVKDEFRLIWFFLVVFASFVLLGKKYGIFLMLLVLISIQIINTYYDLGISKIAQFTFFNSFLIFAAFSYFFLEKIEKDSLEFKSLNNLLKEKVVEEKQQREEQEQMLLRQCRMANMGEMLDSIAHQWRQPLMHINSILLNMDQPQETKKGSKELEDRIDEISALTTHMSQTIEDFRNLFKTEKEQTHFALKAMLDDVLTIMKNHFHDINIEFSKADDISIITNKSELMQVVIIILSNAVEALKTRDIKKPTILISLHETQENYFISIEDNAGGINLSHINKIFDPYFTSKEQTGGTGLGLYIAKIILENNKGRLLAENTSLGAKFTIHMKKEHVKHT